MDVLQLKRLLCFEMFEFPHYFNTKLFLKIISNNIFESSKVGGLILTIC
jgi:hypothetical protein